MSTTPWDTQELKVVVTAALQRDQAAWSALVRRFERLVWKAINMVTADPIMREEAFARTWLSLARALPTVEEPDRLPGWLVTTAVNHVRSLARVRRLPTDSLDALQQNGFEPTSADPPDDRLDGETLRTVVRSAFDRLRPECRQLLTLLVLSDPPMNYSEAATALGLRVGSLGPTRQRCLDALRRSPEIQRLIEEGVPL